VLVRTWNLFHGNAMPPRRTAYLGEMIRLATEDEPDVLCVQEVPAWALGRFTVGDVASRPPLGRATGRAITSLNHGVLRSAVSGQGNAISVAPKLRVTAHHVLVLNTLRFRAQQARELRLDRGVRLAWAKERRIVQAVRLSTGAGSVVVANTHCTGVAGDPRIADAELLRAAWFADSVARPEEPVILAGDFNARTETSRTLAALTSPEWGFSAPAPGIDHVLVRGATASPSRVWPVERRTRVDGAVLSDHAPVEVEVDLG
jgi:endonuclease/exonuclease/phosphatase family metal-dependent hydrolase